MLWLNERAQQTLLTSRCVERSLRARCEADLLVSAAGTVLDFRVLVCMYTDVWVVFWVKAYIVK